ncbi:hypothetical protein MAFF241648_21120 [Ralstonia solanacearum]|nr:hypothetical protein MAFF241648_21120 [Ralstonia solanacearum]
MNKGTKRRTKLVKLVNSHHINKIDVLRKAWGVSNRRAAAIIISYVHDIGTVPSPNRAVKGLYEVTQDNKGCTNIFFPMTGEQFDVATQVAKDAGFDFSTLFRIALDAFYEQWESGTLDYNKNARFANYVKLYNINNKRIANEQ